MTTVKTLNKNGAQYFAGVNRKGIVRWSGFRGQAKEFKKESLAAKVAEELQNIYKVNTPLSIVKDAE